MQLKKNTIERRHAKKKKFRKKGLSPEHRAAENVIPPPPPRDRIKTATPVKSKTGAGTVVEGGYLFSWFNSSYVIFYLTEYIIGSY